MSYLKRRLALLSLLASLASGCDNGKTDGVTISPDGGNSLLDSGNQSPGKVDADIISVDGGTIGDRDTGSGNDAGAEGGQPGTEARAASILGADLVAPASPDAPAFPRDLLPPTETEFPADLLPPKG